MKFRPAPTSLLFPLLLALAALLPLAGCGDLPEPFLGNPGATARRLAVPEAPMLAVPPPAGALLSHQGQEDYAQLLALNLQKAEVPSLARARRPTDWGLAVTASRRGDDVVPRYAILDPSGKELGAIDGAAQPAAGWAAAAPGTLGQAAQDGVPKVLALLMSIRSTRDRADPNSLMHRAAKVFVPIVTGAPGDGNVVLTKLIRERLTELGPLVQLTPEGTDFTVRGTVTVTPLPKAQQQVEIAWTVTRPSGVLVGKVSQLNAVPAGTLDQYWGDVATIVTQEASGGINTVVERFIGRDEPAQAAVTGSGSGGGASPAGGAAGSVPVGAAQPGASAGSAGPAPNSAPVAPVGGNAAKATVPATPRPAAR